jgi:hypothetical protein
MTFPENPQISFRSSNWLTVNKRTLRADVLEFPPEDKKQPISAEQLERVIRMGRQAILPKVPEGGCVWVAQLGTTPQTDPEDGAVFTRAGHENGGVITDAKELQERFHPHWNSIHSAGFMPEIRRISGKADGGAWLSLRRPTIPDVLRHWLKYNESEEGRTIRKRIEEDPTQSSHELAAYKQEGEQYIDAHPDQSRSRQQIGLILAVSAIKRTIQDFEGYETETDDALMYADNDPDIDESTIFAIENSRLS